MARPGRRWPEMWWPAAEQTRLPARSAGPCTGESFGTSSRWLASKYTVENAISSARAQVIVVAFARMSTVSFCTALMRSGSDSRRKSTLSGSPRRSRATSRAMSTLKPCSSPDTGSRKLNGLVLWSTPTINRPRRCIASTAGPPAVDGRRLAVASQLSTAAPDAYGTVVAPLGIGSVVRVADTSASGCTVEQPASRTTASPRAVPIVRISGTRLVVARYRQPPPAPPAH